MGRAKLLLCAQFVDDLIRLECPVSQKVKTEAITENGGIRWFSFYDPDGNRLEICQVT